jgi:hypothetical protein
MTKKIKNQQPKNETMSKNKEQLDILCLAKLQDSLEQANKLLANIFTRLSIDLDRMAEIRKSLEYNPPQGVWTLKQAREYLDVIIINASFGQRPVVENKGLLVQVSAMTEAAKKIEK